MKNKTFQNAPPPPPPPPPPPKKKKKKNFFFFFVEFAFHEIDGSLSIVSNPKLENPMHASVSSFPPFSLHPPLDHRLPTEGRRTGRDS